MKKTCFCIGLILFLAFGSKVFAQIETETIILENSSVCSDFNLKYHSSQTTTPTPLPQGAIQGAVESETDMSGWLKLESSGFPNLSRADNDLFSALSRLLPQDINEEVDLPSNQFNTTVKHFVAGKDKDSRFYPSEINPETRINQPGWFSHLIGTTKILCGFLGTCEPPESVSIKVAGAASPISDPNQGYCLSGQQVSSLESSSPQIITQEFKTKSLLKRITEAILNALGSITGYKTTSESKLANRSRGSLVGGETLRKNWFQALLPESLLSTGNAPLGAQAGYAAYSTTENENLTIERGGEKLNYQGLGATRRDYCLQKCSLLPEGTNIFYLDPLCPSCDPDDYSLVDDIPLDMTYCQKDAQGACDYYAPGDGPRCDGDPICESGKCYPLMYRQAKDYLDHGCPLPYNLPDCNDESICTKATEIDFKKNADGSFGACHYQTVPVCVRTDRVAVDSCAALCNWACCAYQ